MGCNILTGVHVWNNILGHGIELGPLAAQTRFTGCYLDGNHLVVSDPRELVATDNFFLGAHTVFRSVLSRQLEGVKMGGNIYAKMVGHPGDYPSIVLESAWSQGPGAVQPERLLARHPNSTASSPFLGGSNVDISDEVPGSWLTGGGATLKLTRARKALHQGQATRWELDFSDVLLLPSIDDLSYSLVLDDSSLVRHAARKPQGTTVVIETDSPVDATVVVEAWQGRGGAPWEQVLV